jgi:hypothetical protein
MESNFMINNNEIKNNHLKNIHLTPIVESSSTQWTVSNWFFYFGNFFGVLALLPYVLYFLDFVSFPLLIIIPATGLLLTLFLNVFDLYLI